MASNNWNTAGLGVAIFPFRFHTIKWFTAKKKTWGASDCGDVSSKLKAVSNLKIVICKSALYKIELGAFSCQALFAKFC